MQVSSGYNTGKYAIVKAGYRSTGRLIGTIQLTTESFEASVWTLDPAYGGALQWLTDGLSEKTFFASGIGEIIANSVSYDASRNIAPILCALPDGFPGILDCDEYSQHGGVSVFGIYDNYVDIDTSYYTHHAFTFTAVEPSN